MSTHVGAEHDASLALADAVRAAAHAGTPLAIGGGNTKAFYGRPAAGKPLDVAVHRGVVAYEPTELVISARAGTPLAEIEATLAARGQMLGFEPPHFGHAATLGGTMACGFSGPRRPYAGSARDFVLGVKIVNGQGEILTFGGQVMKNVAGFDVSRLMVGALGTLGVLLEISLKVLPLAERELTLAFAMNAEQAIRSMNTWARQPLPLSGAYHAGDRLLIRLSGADAAVRAAAGKLGGEDVGGDPWSELREQRLDFFRGDTPLWRLSLPPATPPLALPGAWLLDWGGAQRWLKSTASAHDIRRAAAAVGGHATLFRGGERAGEIFHPLSPALARLHRNLKLAFDPATILNRGRYSEAW